MYLMGKLQGIGPNQIVLWLRVAQRSRNLKKITKVVASFVSSNPMHSESFGLEREKKFGCGKRNLDTMVGSLNTHITQTK
jgi:hypothetical protein